jgi:uncharacterized Tic20 family protein
MVDGNNVCANCGRAIGALEQPQSWLTNTVCPECYARLRGPGSANPTQAAGSISPVNNNNNYIMAAFPHIGALLGLGFIILPLVVLLASSDEFVRANAREALNFHITLFIYFIIALILCLVFIGFVLFFALILFMFVASLIATVKASQGEMYRYPMTIRMIG